MTDEQYIRAGFIIRKRLLLEAALDGMAESDPDKKNLVAPYAECPPSMKGNVRIMEAIIHARSIILSEINKELNALAQELDTL